MNWLANPVLELRRPAVLPAPADIAWRLVTPAAVAALLGISRLLPETGFGLWVRLAAATLVVLLPGTLVARCLGQRGAAAAFAASVALVGVGLALTVALGASLDVTLGFTLGAGALAFVWSLTGRQTEGVRLPGAARFMRGALVLAGIGLGVGIWFVQGAFTGDVFFHLGRIRKLDALSSLSLHNVGEFAHGGLHPGYAFPLWHAWLALVARLAGVDPSSVAAHESSLLAPLALVLAFEMGWAIFRSTGLGLAVVLGQLGYKVFAPGHAGVYRFLWEPATVATQLLVPAALALFFYFVRKPSWPVAVLLAAASGSIALVHPTYALFLAIPLGAFVVARVLLMRGSDLRNGVLGFVVFGVPVALAFLWLRPVVDQTIPVSPGLARLAHNLHHYRRDLVVHSLSRYNLAPARIDRNGGVTVIGLLLAPLAFFARQRRWSALVLGGTVAVLGIELWPLVFPHFSDAVSLSQSRRASGFIPFAVALAGGAAIVARFSRTIALAGGLASGIWLQVAYAGDYGLHAPRTAPAIVAWIALYGGIAALVIGAALAWRRRGHRPPAGARVRGITAAFAVFLFVLPLAAHGFSHWTPEVKHDRDALTPGLIDFLQRDVPARSVVFADLATSYRAIASAPLYAVAVPPAHAANTHPNELMKRRRAVNRFFTHPSLEEPLAWKAQWLILTRSGPVHAIERAGLRPVYEDAKFVAFRVPAG
ncbi:MAG TPA: hypothetical protein VJ716_08760 [Gaiellaceae bacterium]|nr:hypothetical protein [Gaiellaceae bacterium]